MTILLAEDNDAMRKLLALRLDALGHDVLSADSVAQAISLLESSHVDSVLSDHAMPGGNGLQLLAYVRNRMPDLPFVLMSAVVTPEMEADAAADGVNAVVPKDALGPQLHVLFPPNRARLRASA
jgi:two-component system response regulator GlrR